MSPTEQAIRDAVVAVAYHARPEPGSPAAVAVNALLNLLDSGTPLDPAQARHMAENAMCALLAGESARPDPQGASWMENRLIDFLTEVADPPVSDAEVIDLAAERRRRRAAQHHAPPRRRA